MRWPRMNAKNHPMTIRELYWNYFQLLVTAIAPERLMLMESVNKTIYPAVFSMRPAYKIIDNEVFRNYFDD